MGIKYNYDLAKMRWKTKDPEIKGQDRQILSFLLSERIRIRKSVLQNAQLWQPSRPRLTLPHAHPILKNCLFRAQWELWRWQACLSVLLWTPDIESAWQRTFSDDKFRTITERKWRAFFEIPAPRSSEGGDDWGTLVASVVYHGQWYDQLDTRESGSVEALPGVSVRRALWGATPPKERDVIQRRHREKFPEERGACGGMYDAVVDAILDLGDLQARSRRYLDGAGGRDFMEERTIREDAKMTTMVLRRSLLGLIECEEMNLVMHGSLDGETVLVDSALASVLRLSDEHAQTAVVQTRDNGGSGNPAKVEASAGDKGGEFLPLTGKESSTSSSSTAESPQKETTPDPGGQVDKSEKKSAVAAEVKKTETDEKGKDETGTGVENS